MRVPLAVIAIDAQGHVTTWNKAAEHLFGWSREEVIGRPIPAIPDEGKQQFAALVARRNGETLRGMGWRAAGATDLPLMSPCGFAPTRNSLGRVTGVLAEVMDITEDNRARIQLETAGQPSSVLTVWLRSRPGNPIYTRARLNGPMKRSRSSAFPGRISGRAWRATWHLFTRRIAPGWQPLAQRGAKASAVSMRAPHRSARRHGPAYSPMRRIGRRP